MWPDGALLGGGWSRRGRRRAAGRARRGAAPGRARVLDADEADARWAAHATRRGDGRGRGGRRSASPPARLGELLRAGRPPRRGGDRARARRRRRAARWRRPRAGCGRCASASRRSAATPSCAGRPCADDSCGPTSTRWRRSVRAVKRRSIRRHARARPARPRGGRVTLADATGGAAPRRDRPRTAEAAHVAFDPHHPPERALLDDCVHCGFCLTTCPTYVLWGEEMDSPRGRIPADGLARGRGRDRPHAGPCATATRASGCMACVTACPSGVRYDRSSRRRASRSSAASARPASDGAARALFSRCRTPARCAARRAAGRRTARSGLQRAARRARLHASCRAAAPRGGARAAAHVRSVASRVPAGTAPEGPPRLTVGAAARLRAAGVLRRRQRGDGGVLAAYGCEVVAPREQGCCGALELHAGREATALDRARRTDRRASRRRVDRIAVNSGRLRLDDQGVRPPAGRRPGVGRPRGAVAAKARDVSESWPSSAPPRDALTSCRCASPTTTRVTWCTRRASATAARGAAGRSRASSSSSWRSRPCAAAAPASTTSSSPPPRPTRAAQGRQRPAGGPRRAGRGQPRLPDPDRRPPVRRRRRASCRRSTPSSCWRRRWTARTCSTLLARRRRLLASPGRSR